MDKSKFFKIVTFLIIMPFFLSACSNPDGKFKLPGGDARKNPADPKKRIEQNMKEGKGFRINNFGKQQGGVFDFASSNELWRASLDVLDFMPLSSVNYSGGIIITDWYANNENTDESIKISIRFLTNEIRSDALDIKVFTRKCSDGLNCKIFESNEKIIPELRKQILKAATLYEKNNKEKIKNKNKNYEFPVIESDLN